MQRKIKRNGVKELREEKKRFERRWLGREGRDSGEI
jgi:hypothetical protein